MGSDLLRDALILLSTIDPIGTVLVFAVVSEGMSAVARRRLAGRAVVIAGVTLVGFLVLGQVGLTAMHVSLTSFQIAGGVFLFLFGAQMTLTDFTSHIAGPEEGRGARDPAVFPLAIPAIASPGALLAVVVLTENTRYSTAHQAMTAGVLVGILGLTYLALRWSSHLMRWLGRTGGAALIRILGMILAALAVEMVVEGLVRLGVLRGVGG
ncbi:MAG TPA: MarC family protein [Gemmatimonadales bacterium]|nr:MarC family protein [Gemmatimonadales bacterium]